MNKVRTSKCDCCEVAMREGQRFVFFGSMSEVSGTTKRNNQKNIAVKSTGLCLGCVLKAMLKTHGTHVTTR